ncbi:hypothetical protein, partial [Glutamicibacter sp. NPDC090743]|uniref:hypothetical protein n=2 Tax=Actinomycetota TaxID=201174 RepID=UPI00382C93F2
LFSATRKNYTQVLGVLQIGWVVFDGDRAHLIPELLIRLFPCAQSLAIITELGLSAETLFRSCTEHQRLYLASLLNP